MSFLNDQKFNWKTIDVDGGVLSFKGTEETVKNITSIFVNNLNDVPKIISEVQTIDRYTGGVFETDDFIFAWTDHIRSWPLFYMQEEGQFFISQNAYEIKEKIISPTYDEDSLVEFKLSGYVTGDKTLIKGLKTLNSGEFCIWNKKEKTLNIESYFSYLPTFNQDIPTPDSIHAQNKIFDDLTLRIIKEANGETIWIPLSGGLDSRILLCKLHEHGYTNIQTFTYGPRFNFESFIAKRVAKTLNVPWRFVSVPRKKLKKYYDSDDRKEFFKYAGNLKVIPCMREYGAIRYLQETGQIDDGAIFLNGQSGDYITGGHLSDKTKTDKDYNEETFYQMLMSKHYDLWYNLKTDKNLQIIKNKIKDFVRSITGKDISIGNQVDGARHEEIWEYEGRQICYVANGIRAYEYFGYDWEMPLWEKTLVDFYEPLSFDMKYAQKTYKDYLQSYNYKGLFPAKEPYIWRWPLPMLWVLPVAQIVGLLKGREGKDKFYAKMRYFGHYANQYAFFDYKECSDAAENSRNIIALYIKTWLEEHKLKL